MFRILKVSPMELLGDPSCHNLALYNLSLSNGLSHHLCAAVMLHHLCAAVRLLLLLPLRRRCLPLLAATAAEGHANGDDACCAATSTDCSHDQHRSHSSDRLGKFLALIHDLQWVGAGDVCGHFCSGNVSNVPQSGIPVVRFKAHANAIA
ncbi:unnamed protein product [Polarella glacialis]|uniref:Uncharacterized protein n=1 Tax=Polarella glacialis TaxID=89957 RepID=A0A813JDX9_POLGL|nr:unnamed protein product [Polarella glacialis]